MSKIAVFKRGQSVTKHICLVTLTIEFSKVVKRKNINNKKINDLSSVVISLKSAISLPFKKLNQGIFNLFYTTIALKKTVSLSNQPGIQQSLALLLYRQHYQA